jgi:hypothetical protein
MHNELGHSRPVALKVIRWRHVFLDLQFPGVLNRLSNRTQEVRCSGR